MSDTAIEPCPDCKTVPVPFTNGPWVVHCEACDWDDAPVPCWGLGLSRSDAIKEWNRDAKGRARDLAGGEADPPLCVNRHPPRPREVRCIVCGAVPVVPESEMCGPCTFGEAETAGGNW